MSEAAELTPSVLHGKQTGGEAAAHPAGGNPGRFREVEVVAPPTRVRSNFVKGFTDLPVRLHPR